MRRILPDQTLARHRDQSEANMPHTALITRRGVWVDTGGGSGYYPDADEVRVPCRLAPLGNTALERELAGQLQPLTLERLTCPPDADIRGDDEPVINGVRYTVHGLLPLATYAVERHVIVQRVD